MDIISRLPGSAGQAADAVSAYTHVKMDTNYWKIQIGMSDIWIRLPGHKWPKSWSSMEDPVVPLERNLYGHPLGGLLWERQFEKILLKYGWEKVSNWECLFVHREKGLFLSLYVDDIKLAGKKQNINPMWKVLNKEVDLGEPASFLWSCILGLHSTTMRNKQRYCGQLKNRVWIQNFCRSNWKITMLGITEYVYVVLRYGRPRQEVWNVIVNQPTKLLNNFTTYQFYALMTINSKKKNWNQLEICQIYALKLFWNAFLCTYWTIRYSMVSEQICTIDLKMDQSLWQRLSRLISYIHHTCEYKQYCYVGNTAKQCWLGLFQDSDFAGDLEDSKSTSGGTLCIFGSPALVPTSWMWKKQTAVSDSSTESEIISLDTGLRMDGLPALELWDLIVSVLGSISRVSDRSGKPDMPTFGVSAERPTEGPKVGV